MNQNSFKDSSLYIVSDFHGMSSALSNIEKKLKKGNKIVILGDALDRGKNGLAILYKIKQLSLSSPNIIYIPGNHDQMFFAFFYDTLIKCKGSPIGNTVQFIQDIKETIRKLVRENLEPLKSNGQLVTLQSVFSSLKETEPKTLSNFINLLDWIGDQPLLKIIEEDGKKYALSHAAFDMSLYNDYKGELSLKDLATCSEDDYNKAIACLWYREEKKEYHNIVELPTTEEVHRIVVGHSPGKRQVSIIGKNITRIAICVDGGIYDLKNNTLNLSENELLAYIPRNGNRLTRISFKQTSLPIDSHDEK